MERGYRLPTCPICASDKVAETLFAKELSKGTGHVFDYAVCATCSSVYIVQFPHDIGRYYEGYYSFAAKVPTLERSWAKMALVTIYAHSVIPTGVSKLVRETFRCPTPRQMDYLSPNLQAFLFLAAKPGARILDVGSGRGEFVQMMRRFGYAHAVGIDPFLEIANEYAAPIDLFSMSGRYDVILFNHSLEHMTEITGAIQKAADLLDPSGTLIVHIPNLNAQEFAIYKEHWCWLHVPYHFAIPSRRGLEWLARKFGLEIVDAICTSRGDHYLYHDEYRRDIGDRDPRSARRKLEAGTFDRERFRSLARMAQSLNRNLTGDWIAYYLKRR